MVGSWATAGGHHALLGSIDVTLDELLRKRSGAYPLVAPGRNGRDAGSLVVESVELVARPSFLDYIKGGCEIAFTVRQAFMT